MIIRSVQINNYKSIGDNKNIVLLENNITSLIGKNESGKSNALEALGDLSFIKPIISSFFSEKTRNRVNSEPVSCLVVLEFTEAEEEKYEVKDQTIFSFSNENVILIEGGLITIFNNVLQENFSLLIEAIEINPFNFQSSDLQSLRTNIAYLKSFGTTYITNISLVFKNINSWLTRIADEDIKSRIRNLNDTTEKEWKYFINILPAVLLRRSEKVLENSYTYEQASKEIGNPLTCPNSLLTALLDAIHIPKENMLKVLQSPLNGVTKDIIENINDNINIYINKPFAQFYKQETIELKVDFYAGVVNFFVKSNGKVMEYSERSNGLRWFLNLFIDLKSRDIKENNIVFLLDEPGVYLHVNAQKELLHLFNNLAESGNQIVYTTHSPYMLNTQTIHHIRAIEKNKSGYTIIHKNVYPEQLCPENKADTLTPLLKAIGLDSKYNIGPDSNKKNIITEGITDYIYIQAMLSFLNINIDSINIIPAIGASNVTNICSILFGWGYNYSALFDFDKEGVEESKKLSKHLLLELNKDYFFVIDVTENDIERQLYKVPEYRKVIENLIDEEDKKYFICDYNDYDDVSKTIVAKRFDTDLSLRKFIPSELTICNFKNLFTRLGIL